MNSLHEFQNVLQEIAEKAERGEYGNNPWEHDDVQGPSDAKRAMTSEAFDKVGKYLPDVWNDYDEISKVGGAIMDDIRFRYDMIVEADAIENSQDTIAAFDAEMEMSNNYQQTKPPETIDDTVLRPETNQTILDFFAERNLQLIADGKEPVVFQKTTIEELEARGLRVDPSFRQSGEDEISKVDNDKVTAIPGKSPETASADQYRDLGDQSVKEETENKDGETSMQGVTENERRKDMENETLLEKAGFIIERNETGEITDLKLKDVDNSSISDIFKDAYKADPEAMKDILAKTAAVEASGGDSAAYFKSAINEWAEDYKTKNEISQSEKDVEHPVDNAPKNDIEIENKQAKYEERFEHHSEIVKDRMAVVPYRDTFTSYHNMAKIYDAYKGGIEINGRVPDIADVMLAVNSFSKTNILESITIEIFRGVVRALSNDEQNDVEGKGVDSEGKNGSDIIAAETDKFGVADNGYTPDNMDKDTAIDIKGYRDSEPMAGRYYGTDMTTKPESADNDRYPPGMRVFTTNPDRSEGKGVAVGLDSGHTYAFPDIRMVEYKGDRMLVDPFGKVLDVDSGSGKYRVGDYLGGLDVSSFKNGAAALDTYAREKGVTIPNAKEQITAAVKERFCDRIEKTYRTEASSIRDTVKTREVEVRRELVAKEAALGHKEKMEAAAGNKAGAVEISKMRADIKAAIGDVDKRIHALELREIQLEKKADKIESGTKGSLERRFADAVESEKSAVGRSVVSIDTGIDKDGKIDKAAVDAVHSIRAAVEKYNADKPEMGKVSYDIKTGDIVSRWGITTDGRYVGNENGKFMADKVDGPLGKDDEKNYIDKHQDKGITAEKVLGIEPDSEDKVEADKKDLDAASEKDIDNSETENSDAAPEDVEISEKDDVDADNKDPVDGDSEPNISADEEQNDDLPDVEDDEEDVEAPESSVVSADDIDDEKAAVDETDPVEEDFDKEPDDTVASDIASESYVEIPETDIPSEVEAEEEIADDTDVKVVASDELPGHENAEKEYDVDIDDETAADPDDIDDAKEFDKSMDVDALDDRDTGPAKDGEITAIDVKTAVDAGGEKIEEREDTERRDRDDDRREELQDIIGDMLDCADSGDTDLNGDYGALLDRFEEIMSIVDDPDKMDDAILGIAEAYANNVGERLEGNPGDYEKVLASGSEVLDSIAQALGVENGAELIGDIYDISDDPDMDPLTADCLQDSTRDASNNLHAIEVEMSECDFGPDVGYADMDGLYDIDTGEEIGGFMDDFAMNDFEIAMYDNIDSMINDVDFNHNDIESGSDSLDDVGVPELDFRNDDPVDIEMPWQDSQDFGPSIEPDPGSDQMEMGMPDVSANDYLDDFTSLDALEGQFL